MVAAVIARRLRGRQDGHRLDRRQRPVGIGAPGRLRAGAALVAHGEFSIVIAELGIAREHDLGALAATYVIILTLVGALLYQFSDALFAAGRKRRHRFLRLGAGGTSART